MYNFQITGKLKHAACAYKDKITCNWPDYLPESNNTEPKQEQKLTSTSEGTIFMIPLTKSWEELRSVQILWESCSCTSMSLPLLSSVITVAVWFSLKPEFDGKFGGASAPGISSNFSSNWLEWQRDKDRMRGPPKTALSGHCS